ncbi:hypothetical protein NDU88_000625 [Pleurodeles waltl]|uniref:Uncharacterized protein n=1 Tax=Pleurodeles waltl TaxID=8319 RepID=A0AAV7P1D2_PLEWA|nr:hypothetical protein NDU88_000625 [Pleurodeles waltl]
MRNDVIHVTTRPVCGSLYFYPLPKSQSADTRRPLLTYAETVPDLCRDSSRFYILLSLEGWAVADKEEDNVVLPRPRDSRFTSRACDRESSRHSESRGRLRR